MKHMLFISFKNVMLTRDRGSFLALWVWRSGFGALGLTGCILGKCRFFKTKKRAAKLAPLSHPAFDYLGFMYPWLIA
jgi:hypothetical protein